MLGPLWVSLREARVRRAAHPGIGAKSSSALLADLVHATAEPRDRTLEPRGIERRERHILALALIREYPSTGRVLDGPDVPAGQLDVPALGHVGTKTEELNAQIPGVRVEPHRVTPELAGLEMIVRCAKDTAGSTVRCVVQLGCAVVPQEPPRPIVRIRRSAGGH